MSDIVERLREHCMFTDWQVAIKEAHEAADRIEQLEAALLEAERLKLMWRKWYDNEVGVSEGLRKQLAEARATLG